MPYSPVKAETFGGLNLADPGEVAWSGAIDLLNVEFFPGIVRSRYGFVAGSASAASAVLNLIYLPSTDDWLVASTTAATALQVFSNDFSTVRTVTRIDTTTGTSQSTTGTAHDFALFGSPTANYVYIANGTDQVRRFQPSNLTFTAPAGLATFTGGCVGLTPWDNRLVVSDSTNVSRVWFSDAGTPETIGANNYVELHPGDGERIRAIKSWRDLLFVFKETKFFVFYGTSTDSSGNPIFNYRAVNTGIGQIDGSSGFGFRRIAPGPDGIYFYHLYKGVFKSDGGPPVEASGAVRPAMQAVYGVGYGSGLFFNAADDAPPLFDSLVWSANRLYCVDGRGSGAACYVYDRDVDAWSYWSVPDAATVVAATGRQNNDSEVLAIACGTTLYSYFRDQANTTDNGTAINSYYRSGFSDLGSPDLKTIREWRLQGSGSPTLKVSQDFGSLDAGAAVTLGTFPAIAEDRRRYALRGRQLSWQVGKTSGQWTLNSLVANVREKRAPGVHASA